MPAAAAPIPSAAPPARIASLDIMRGVVMVLMAIDHVRVYSGLPAGGPTAGIFFTRWVTHFCAPAFVFLAGTAAFLHGLKIGDRRVLARYLVTRGLVLILELTVIRASWTFTVDYSQFILAGVIWMLGWCMVLLAALIWLPVRAIGAMGLAVIVFQNVFGLIGSALPEPWRPIWEFIYPVGAELRLGQDGPGVSVLYTIVPWIGVMAAGYAFGAHGARAAERRAVPSRPGPPPALIRLLNQRPASVLFLAMTLGPTIALLPLAERARGWVAEGLATFGRVPMFYYLLHIPVIHAAALFVLLMRDGSVHPEWYATAPYTSVPPEHRWGLPLLYLVFVSVLALLYFPCRWFARVKARRRQAAWIRYL